MLKSEIVILQNQSKSKRKMKKVLTLFLLFMALCFSGYANDRNDGTNTQNIKLDISLRSHKIPTHRTPIHIALVSYYDAESQTVTINYDGEASGEVFLYYNDTLIGYETEINSSFQVSMNGLYKIEILTESWSAEGYFEL